MSDDLNDEIALLKAAIRSAIEAVETMEGVGIAACMRRTGMPEEHVAVFDEIERLQSTDP